MQIAVYWTNLALKINLILQNRRPVIYGDGEQKRTFSDVEDCIYCLDKLILDPNIKSQVFNIGPDEEFVTINKIAEICSNITGLNLEAVYKKDRPREVKHAICSADKARKLLNYQTKVDLIEGVKKTYDYIKKRGTKDFNYRLNIEIDNDLTPETWKNKEI